jgi:hypothetical protein
VKIRQTMIYLPLAVFYLAGASNVRAAGAVTGKVTAEDRTANASNVSASTRNVSKLVGLHVSGRADAGQDDAIRNAVVYVSSGASSKVDSKRLPISIAQDGCHLGEAVLHMGVVPLAPYTGQNVNSADEEIIPVRCNNGAGLRKYFVVLKPSHYYVTGENGTFSIGGLTPGKYTITAWDETLGGQTQEITISGDETVPTNFVFQAKSKT